MRRHAVSSSRRVGTVVLVGVLLAAGCTDDPAPVVPSPTPTPTPSAAAVVTYDEAVAALAPDLVPTAQVRPCEELVPGSPEAQEHLDRVAAELEAAATDEEAGAAPTPTLPSCGMAAVEALRAASITGLAHGPDDETVLPVAGGAARVVEVYELADPDAAAAGYAARIADEEGWAVDQEVPRQELDGGSYVPRRVVSGARVEGVDLAGWTAAVLSRDEASFQDDGSPASDAVSYGHLWAVRDTVLVRVQVAGDVPGAAAATALETARAFTARVEAEPADG